MALQLISAMTIASNSLRATAVLLGLWGILSTLEWLASSGRWRPGGALGWDLQSLRRGRLYRSALVSWSWNPAVLKMLLLARLFASTLLIFGPLSGLTPVLFACVAAITALLALRTAPDGADKIAMVVAYGGVLQGLGLAWGQPLLTLAGLLWVGVQISLCYTTSGVSKVVIPHWRNGQALKSALSSYTYGSHRAAIVMRHKSLAFGLSWGIILAECVFPLTLFGPQSLLALALACLLLLHVGTAIVMGFNTYPWAFVAAYPSVLLLHNALHTCRIST